MKKQILFMTIALLAVSVQAAPVTCSTCTDGGLSKDEPDVVIQAVFPPSVPLSEIFRTQVTGDYVAAGVSLRTSASGNISITLPAGATIQNAYLYWAIMENSSTPSAALFNAILNGNGVVGALLGTAGDPCWLMGFIHSFVADVTAFAQAGVNSVTLANIGGILREGASLVVIYNDPSSSIVKEVIIQGGAVTFAGAPTETVTFSTFSATPSSANAKTTWIIGDGQAVWAPTTIFDDSGQIAIGVLQGNDPGGEVWDTRTDTVIDVSDDTITLGILTSLDCLTWVAQVIAVELSIEVDVDIKGGSCPNPFNPKSKGSVPVAILASAAYVLADINPNSIRLNGVLALQDHWIFEDSTEPPTGDPADCDDCFEAPVGYSGDGVDELVVKFYTQELAASLSGTPKGTCVELQLTGTTFGGIPIEGSDSMLIKKDVP